MRKQNKPKPKNVPKKGKKQQQRPTPFTNAGGSAGSYLGGLVGLPNIGKGIGRFLGAGIGSIFGSGDYTMVGQNPKYNTLSGSIPQFSSTRATNIVCHREYIGDISGTDTFTNRSYPLNPGMDQTFPWLSSIAAGYQQYRIHGLIFEFNPLITDFITGGAPGVIIMSTNYDASEVTYGSKQEMENAEYAVSVKPTNQLMHMVECADQQTASLIKYVRTGSLGTSTDTKTYDHGNFQFATQGNPTQLLGELWVSYCIEFFKPCLPSSQGNLEVKNAQVRRTIVATSNPLGTAQTFNRGSLAVVVTSNAIIFQNLMPNQTYGIEFCWSGSVAAAWAPPSFATPVNYSFISNPGFANNTATNSTTTAGASVTTAHYLVHFVPQVTNITITLNLDGVFPTGTPGLDMYIFPLEKILTV